MHKTPVFLSILILSLLGVGIILAALNNSLTIPTSGNIKTIGIECDTSNINWGTLEPASQKTIIINVRASGNAPVVLSINTQAWQPSSVTQYITFSHNYQNQQVTSTWFPIALTLTVNANAEGIDAFSFDILIVGSET